jgi:nucleoside-diphosphate-sugar epimerase
MKILVTGAAGFIGDSLVKRLVKEGYIVKCLIHNTNPRHPEEKAEYIRGDITKLISIVPVIKDVDVVFHCAAFVKDFGFKHIFKMVNFEGTKNLVKVCEKSGVKKFIYLSHRKYGKIHGFYSETKILAEKYLIDKYMMDKFPSIILRPGNVYGPGESIWVIRILEAIQKNHITLIDHGKGIFLHTYIDNLLDAMILAMNESKAIGEIFDITDGDNNTFWIDYFNAISKMLNRSPIKKNLSKEMIFFISKIMMINYYLFRIEPWITPTAVEILTNRDTVSIVKAKEILHYKPKIDFEEGLNRVETWLRNERLIM